MHFDTIIVGGGLAGACAAFRLSRTGQHVLLLEKSAPGAGASGAAAGLVNPFMARRARPTWRFGEALAALHTLLNDAGCPDLFRPVGVLRPAREEKQATAFRETADAHPDDATWLPSEAAAERCPTLQVPHGALWIPHGGAVDVPEMIHALLKAAEANGAEVRTDVRVTDWGEDDDTAWVEVAEMHERFTARRVVLALGQGYPAFPELRALGLRGVKGQTARARLPNASGLDGLPALSGTGYVVPDSETLLVGSSYAHDFDDLAPSSTITHRILEKAARMLPALADAHVLDERAGVRVYPPQGCRALLDVLPGHERIWIFSGLGSRGLLTAPLLARGLPHFLEDPQALPEPVRRPSE